MYFRFGTSQDSSSSAQDGALGVQVQAIEAAGSSGDQLEWLNAGFVFWSSCARIEPVAVEVCMLMRGMQVSACGDPALEAKGRRYFALKMVAICVMRQRDGCRLHLVKLLPASTGKCSSTSGAVSTHEWVMNVCLAECIDAGVCVHELSRNPLT